MVNKRIKLFISEFDAQLQFPKYSVELDTQYGAGYVACVEPPLSTPSLVVTIASESNSVC